MISKEQEIKELVRLFRKIDLDGDGVLSFNEIHKELEKQGQTDESQIKTIFDSMDIDKSGRIEQTEFIASMIEHKHMHCIDDDSVERTFNFMDRDSSGFIDRAELIKIVGHENENVVDYILSQ